jgi:hypothetical protein
LISKLPEEEFDLEPKKDVWVISCGRIKAEMKLLSGSVMDKVNNIKVTEWKDLPEDFYDALKCCKMGCNGTPLAGIFVQGKDMFSTDNKRIHHFVMKTPMDYFWVSDPSITELIKLGNIKKYNSEDQWLNFQTENQIRFSIRKMMADRYPYKKLLTILEKHEKDPEDLDLTLPNTVFESLERAFVLSGKTEDYFPICIHLHNDYIKIISEKMSGKYEEKLDWENKEDFPTIVMNVDYNHIKNALQRSLEFYVKRLNKGMLRVIFHSGAYRGIINVINKEE